jgi:hypothetical protein
MRPTLYMLDDNGTPVPMKSGDRDDVLQWARSLEKNRIVKQSRGNGLFISTVFLGLRSASIATRARPRGVAPGVVRGILHMFFCHLRLCLLWPT